MKKLSAAMMMEMCMCPMCMRSRAHFSDVLSVI